MSAAFTLHQLLALDADLRSTEANKAITADFERKRDYVDLDLLTCLKNSVRVGTWRKRAGLPPRPTREQVAAWHALLSLKGHLRGWRRRHPVTDNHPTRAA